MVVEQMMKTKSSAVSHEEEYPGVQQLVFTIIVLMTIRIEETFQFVKKYLLSVCLLPSWGSLNRRTFAVSWLQEARHWQGTSGLPER